MLRLAIARHDQDPGEAVAAPAWFGDAERVRWTSMPASGRSAFVASRRLLRQLLEDATAVAFDRWLLTAQAGRAPLASTDADVIVAPAVSVSHRLGWVAAAVSDAGPVGVDVECDRPPRSAAADRAALMLSSAELDAWRASPEDAREAALLCAWVAKEAWYKARPAGTASWDFRTVSAEPCLPERANVRVWRAAPLWVALCCADAATLAASNCVGLEGAATASSWHVGHVG